MHVNEAAFSRRLMALLRKAMPFVQRIESGTTGRGVPDVYAVYDGREVWLELKNIRRSIGSVTTQHIPWRPAQQAWALDYCRAVRGNRCVLTVVAFTDGYGLVRNNRHYIGNIVPYDDMHRCNDIHELVLAIKYAATT